MTHSTANIPGPDELREMSPEEAMLAGAESGGVHVVHRRQRYPIPGTKAEKRAERGVSFMFGLAALAGVAFIVVFVAWPYVYHLPGEGSQRFRFYTPLLGGLLGLMLLGMGFGAVLWAKWLMPEEEAVEERDDEPSPDEEKLMTAATLSVGFEDTGLQRRRLDSHVGEQVDRGLAHRRARCRPAAVVRSVETPRPLDRPGTEHERVA